MFKIFIGYDEREKEAYDVLQYSIRVRSSKNIDIVPLKLKELQDSGLFNRPLSTKHGILWDDISDRPCSTEFSLSRFLVPIICRINKDTQWALFMDCDMLLQADICELESMLDDRYAVMCTKHIHLVNNQQKMDGQIQIPYVRKNWSSFMLFNCTHPANKLLSVHTFNDCQRDWLHQFKWLEDNEIGDIPLEWNHLSGYSKPINGDGNVYPQYDYKKLKNIHFTSGMPFMAGYENCEYSTEWKREQRAFHRSLIEVKK